MHEYDYNVTEFLLSFHIHSCAVCTASSTVNLHTRLVYIHTVHVHAWTRDPVYEVKSSYKWGDFTSLCGRRSLSSVKFNPFLPHMLAYASADHNAYYLDVRKPTLPLQAMVGHPKAVSYGPPMNLSPRMVQLMHKQYSNIVRCGYTWY